MRSAAVGHQCPECVGDGRAGGGPGRPDAVRRRCTLGHPIVTYVLIGINVLMFVLQTVSADVQRALVLWSPAVADGELYRLLTSAFLHYGMTHILFNMWALYVVGPPLEMALGKLRFGALYLLSALGGSVLVYLLSDLGAADRGGVGRGVRVVRRDVRGGQEAQHGCPLGDRDHRAEPGLHVRHPVDQLTEHQLAGAHRRARHRRCGRGGVRLRARQRRNLVQAGATVAVLVLLVALVWWRTAELRAMIGVA